MDNIIYTVEDIIARGNGVTVIVSNPDLREPVHICFNQYQFDNMSERELELEIEQIISTRISTGANKISVEERCISLKDKINSKMEARKLSLKK